MCRIEHIEPPTAQLLVPPVSALTAIHPKRNESKQCAESSRTAYAYLSADDVVKLAELLGGLVHHSEDILGTLSCCTEKLD